MGGPADRGALRGPAASRNGRIARHIRSGSDAVRRPRAKTTPLFSCFSPHPGAVVARLACYTSGEGVNRCRRLSIDVFRKHRPFRKRWKRLCFDVRKSLAQKGFRSKMGSFRKNLSVLPAARRRVRGTRADVGVRPTLPPAVPGLGKPRASTGSISGRRLPPCYIGMSPHAN